MFTVIIVIHLFLAVALIGVVLLQKSEGGALGMGGGGGMSGFMTGRSTANLLTRTTAALVTAFFATSIALAIIAAHQRAPTSVVDQPAGAPSAPSLPAAPAAPAEPSVPLTK